MKKKGFNVPILVLAFKRIVPLKKVLESIKQIKPKNLYISCDGPNPNNTEEIIKVNATRNLIKNFIDWDCDLKLNFSEINQGCKLGATNGINWFFNHVKEGIILEDDTVPHLDFFSYCEELLEKYRNDKRIWSITGTNFNEKVLKDSSSYFFSKYPSLWGWATWRRVWKNYDVNLTYWPDIKKNKITQNLLIDPLEREYWEIIWSNLYYRNIPNTWCYQWTLSCLLNNGLNIYPKTNLIQNIGFGIDATHTIKEEKPLPFGKGMRLITHPKFIISNKIADKYLIDVCQNLKNYRFPFGIIILKIKQKYLRIIKMKLRDKLIKIKI